MRDIEETISILAPSSWFNYVLDVINSIIQENQKLEAQLQAEAAWRKVEAEEES